MQVMEQKNAKAVSIIVMNPQNGEIMAMVNVPEFSLNDPFTLNYELTEDVSAEEKQNLLNMMWRNRCINDTYEPGSTFKIVTASAGLSEGVVSVNDQFYCPGYKIVEDRRIRCHKVSGHGAEDFVHGAMNSCNPVFIEVGLRLGVSNMYKYFNQFGLLSKTGIDLPGEASTIMHKQDNVACSNSPSVTLLQVGRSPRRIKMMNCHTPFLCVHTRSEHGGGAERIRKVSRSANTLIGAYSSL